MLADADIQQSIHKVRASYIKMLFYGLGTMLMAILIARTFNEFCPLTQLYVRVLEYMGYICWGSTLGMLGWEIQTWDGNSPAEKLNQKLGKVLSLIGIFAFIMSRELVPIN